MVTKANPQSRSRAARAGEQPIPAAGGNVWWIEMVPGSHFTYNLRRLGTDRFFNVRFDLTRTVIDSEAPWAWKY
ncbi:MAG: hypothetical protein IPN29_03085 [Saprospiraceae bacterium]|nr:hypothetical protein [Saprospiraceae bacterium]